MKSAVCPCLYVHFSPACVAKLLAHMQENRAGCTAATTPGRPTQIAMLKQHVSTDNFAEDFAWTKYHIKTGELGYAKII